MRGITLSSGETRFFLDPWRWTRWLIREIFIISAAAGAEPDLTDPRLEWQCWTTAAVYKSAGHMHSTHSFIRKSNKWWQRYKGAFHQRRSSLNQVQIWPWPRYSRNFCCTNAVQIKSRVKLGLTLNRRGRQIKLWSSVQLALNIGPRTVIPAIFVQIGDNVE